MGATQSQRFQAFERIFFMILIIRFQGEVVAQSGTIRGESDSAVDDNPLSLIWPFRPHTPSSVPSASPAPSPYMFHAYHPVQSPSFSPMSQDLNPNPPSYNVPNPAYFPPSPSPSPEVFPGDRSLSDGDLSFKKKIMAEMWKIAIFGGIAFLSFLMLLFLCWHAQQKAKEELETALIGNR